MEIKNQTFAESKTFSDGDVIECTFTGKDSVIRFANGHKAIGCHFIDVTVVSGQLIDCSATECTFTGRDSVLRFTNGHKATGCKFVDVTTISGLLIDCDLDPSLGIPQTFTQSKTFSTCDAVHCTFTGEDSAIVFQNGYRAIRCTFGDIAAIYGPVIDCSIDRYSLRNYTANVCMTLKPGIMMCDGKVIKEGESFEGGNNISIRRTVIPRSSPKEPEEKKKAKKCKKEKRTKQQQDRYPSDDDDDDEMTMFYDEETNSITYAGKNAIALNGNRGIINGEIVDLRK